MTSTAAATPWLAATVRLAWRTKLMFSAAVDARIRLRQRAEEDAVAVFAKNLKDLLLAAPAGTRTTLGLDPGFRTGVKVAVVDATGKVVDTCAIYPHQPQQQWDTAKATLAALVARHGVELIAIGNGTASRETDALATELIADIRAAGAARTGQGHGERGRRVGVLGLGVCGPRTARSGRHAAGRGVDRAPAAGSAGRTGEDRPQVDRRGAVPARRDTGHARPQPGCRGRGRGERGGRRSQHRVGAAARTGVRGVGIVGRGHRRAPREDRRVPQPRRAAGRSAVGAQGIRTMRGLPADPRRRRPARRLRRPSRGLPGGAAHPRSFGRDAGRTHRQRAVAASAAPRRLRR